MKRLLLVLALVAVGRSADETVRGVVLDPSGNALPGARVTLRSPDGCCLLVPGHSFRNTTTDARGRFDFFKPPQDMELHAEHPGYSVAWGAARDGAVLRVQRPAYIEGTVSGPATLRATLGLRLLATTEASGEFRLGPLPPGVTILLSASSGGHRTRQVDLALNAGETKRIRLELADGLALTGRVTPAEQGVVVRASQGEARESRATTAADGTFTLRGLQAGAVRVVVLSDGREPLVVDGTAGDHMEVRLDR